MENLHLYSKAIPINGGQYSKGYLLIDEEYSIWAIGTENVGAMPNHSFVDKQALRDGLEIAIRDFEPETIYIHAPEVGNPALEIGRLPPEIRRTSQRQDFTLTRNHQEHCQDLMYGLVEQLSISGWEYIKGKTAAGDGPFTIYTDGSHRPEEESSTIGVLICDSEDRVVDLYNHQLDTVRDSLHSEFKAVLSALGRLNKVAPQAEVTLCTDNQTIYDSFEREGYSTPERVRAVSDEMKSLSKIRSSFEAEHISRNRNTLADALADIAHTQKIELYSSLRTLFSRYSREKTTNTKYSIS